MKQHIIPAIVLISLTASIAASADTFNLTANFPSDRVAAFATKRGWTSTITVGNEPAVNPESAADFAAGYVKSRLADFISEDLVQEIIQTKATEREAGIALTREAVRANMEISVDEEGE